MIIIFFTSSKAFFAVKRAVLNWIVPIISSLELIPLERVTFESCQENLDLWYRQNAVYQLIFPQKHT